MRAGPPRDGRGLGVFYGRDFRGRLLQRAGLLEVWAGPSARTEQPGGDPGQSGLAVGVASSAVGVALVGGVSGVGVASIEELPLWAWPLLESSGRGVARACLKSRERRAERRGVGPSAHSHSSASNLATTVEPQQ